MRRMWAMCLLPLASALQRAALIRPCTQCVRPHRSAMAPLMVDERIARLEASIDELEAVGCAEETLAPRSKPAEEEEEVLPQRFPGGVGAVVHSCA